MYLIIFILCSHVFGMVLDPRDLEGSQIAATADVEDVYGSLLCFMPQCAASLVILVR